MTATEKTVNDYLTSLQNSLKALPSVDREDVIREITAHIRDSLDQGLTVEQILLQLGSAKELGAQFRDMISVRRASRARSPWSMLRSVLRLTKTGAVGAACFLIALIGYVSGAGLLVTALLKPLFPNQIGLWVGPGVFHFGFHDAGFADGGVGLLALSGGPAREVLGPWYIPVTCVLGALFIWGTTIILRRLVKRIHAGRWRRYNRMDSISAATGV